LATGNFFHLKEIGAFQVIGKLNLVFIRNISSHQTSHIYYKLTIYKTVWSKLNFPLFSFTVPEWEDASVFTTLYPHHLISDEVTFETLSNFFGQKQMIYLRTP
jgi:hypothetical protein